MRRIASASLPTSLQLVRIAVSQNKGMKWKPFPPKYYVLDQARIILVIIKEVPSYWILSNKSNTQTMIVLVINIILRTDD